MSSGCMICNPYQIGKAIHELGDHGSYDRGRKTANLR